MNLYKKFGIKKRLARWLHRMKNHPNQALRVTVAILFIIGGLLWFLPILGLWMLPVGLVILFARSPAYWRLRRRYVGWRRQRRLNKAQTKS
jgi:hypothetical protein